MTTKTQTKKTETVAAAPVAEQPKKKGWRIKQYFVNKAKYDHADTQAALAKAPNQVRIMMSHFAENYADAGKAEQGRVMCQSAIDNGGLKTVIEPAVLFAYYRKVMEGYGLELKG